MPNIFVTTCYKVTIHV